MHRMLHLLLRELGLFLLATLHDSVRVAHAGHVEVQDVQRHEHDQEHKEDPPNRRIPRILRPPHQLRPVLQRHGLERRVHPQPHIVPAGEAQVRADRIDRLYPVGPWLGSSLPQAAHVSCHRVRVLVRPALDRPVGQHQRGTGTVETSGAVEPVASAESRGRHLEISSDLQTPCLDRGVYHTPGIELALEAPDVEGKGCEDDEAEDEEEGHVDEGRHAHGKGLEQRRDSFQVAQLPQRTERASQTEDLDKLLHP
eukprot:762424-Hanusia_phi.AAC.8